MEVVRIALGKTTVRKPVSDKVGGKDDKITRALGVVAEFKKGVVDVAIVLAWFLAEVIDDNDTGLLQFFQLIVQLSGRYAHHIAVRCKEDWQYTLADERLAKTRTAKTEQATALIVREPLHDTVVTMVAG